VPGELLRGTQYGGRIPAMAEARESLMRQIRKSRGLSLAVVAAEVRTDPGNLSRVENGEQPPKRDLARSLYRYYGGAVPLGQCYDPTFCE
jgi:transcriptional regulator with XRE-family HTH domain